MQPGDRKYRWQSSCQTGGLIMLFLAGLLISTGNTAGYVLGGIFLCALCNFRDAKRGWKIRYDLPPKYYRDIRSPNPITREIAREAGEATLKAAQDPNRPRYAFERKRKRK